MNQLPARTPPRQLRPGRQRDEPQRRLPVPLPGAEPAEPRSGLLRRHAGKRSSRQRTTPSNTTASPTSRATRSTVLSVLNAGLGIIFVHTTYAELTQQQVDDGHRAADHRPDAEVLHHPHREPAAAGAAAADPADRQPAGRSVAAGAEGDRQPRLRRPQVRLVQRGIRQCSKHPSGSCPTSTGARWPTCSSPASQQGVKDFVADVSPGGVMWQELALDSSCRQPGSVHPPPSPSGIITGAADGDHRHRAAHLQCRRVAVRGAAADGRHRQRDRHDAARLRRQPVPRRDSAGDSAASRSTVWSTPSACPWPPTPDWSPPQA